MFNLAGLIILIISLSLVYKYCLDIKLLYPEWILDIYFEPFNRFVLYMLLFVLARINPTYAIIYLIVLIFGHIDILLFIK